MNKRLELAKAVYPVCGNFWFEYNGGIYWQPGGDFDGPDSTLFDPENNPSQAWDVLAWISARSEELFAISPKYVGLYNADSDDFFRVVGYEHDGTASGIRRAILEAALRCV